MVFVGNINQSVESLLKTSSLFDPFPSEIGTDTAFFDRMHCYIPGWEIPKYRPEFLQMILDSLQTIYLNSSVKCVNDLFLMHTKNTSD